MGSLLKCDGDDALAAVNIAYPLTAFLQAVGTGIGMGGAIEYAINAGNQNENRGRQYMGMAILLLGGFSILFTALFLFAGPQILGLFGASGEILEYSSEYLRFVSYGAVFQIAGTGLVPFIRNMGGAVTAMAAMVTGFITNIVLDYLFVWVLPWGMMGAAVATAIGQAMTFLVCLVFFVLKKHAPSFQFDGEGGYLASRILGVGLSPFGLTYSPNITLILLNKSAVIFGGNIAVTCYAPISYISAVVMLLMQGVSDGSQPLISLAYGEGKHDTTKAVRRSGVSVCLRGSGHLLGHPFPAAGQRGLSVRRLRTGGGACGADPADLHYRFCLCQRVQGDHRLFLCDRGKKSFGPTF